MDKNQAPVMIRFCFKKCVHSFNGKSLLERERECVKECRNNYNEIVK
jgi:hypothetical protein